MGKFLDKYLKDYRNLPEVELNSSESLNEEEVSLSQAEKYSMIITFIQKTSSIEEIADKCRKLGFWNAEAYIAYLVKRGELIETSKGNVRLV